MKNLVSIFANTEWAKFIVDYKVTEIFVADGEVYITSEYEISFENLTSIEEVALSM